MCVCVTECLFSVCLFFEKEINNKKATLTGLWYNGIECTFIFFTSGIRKQNGPFKKSSYRKKVF